MSRLVRKPKLAEAAPPQAADFGGIFQATARAAPVSAAVAGDDYLTRMAKYVPAEVLGFSSRRAQTLRRVRAWSRA
jgi:hypothetical protein